MRFRREAAPARPHDHRRLALGGVVVDVAQDVRLSGAEFGAQELRGASPGVDHRVDDFIEIEDLLAGSRTIALQPGQIKQKYASGPHVHRKEISRPKAKQENVSHVVHYMSQDKPGQAKQDNGCFKTTMQRALGSAKT